MAYFYRVNFSTIILGILLTALSSPIFAALEMSNIRTTSTHVPSGHSHLLMYQFELSSTAEDVRVERISFSNTSSYVSLGTGVTSATLFLDSNRNALFEPESDFEVDTISFSSYSSGAQFSFTQDILISSTNAGVGDSIISTDTSKVFFITYSFSPGAALAKNANFSITEITATDPTLSLDLTSETSITTVNNVTVTGLDLSSSGTFEIRSIAPDVVIPGQKNVPMLYIALTTKGESISNPGGTNYFVLSIENSEENFVSKNISEAGVVTSYLYKPSFPPNPSFSSDAMGKKILTVDSFDANNTLQFKDPFASPTGFKSFNEGVTQLFYVLYDIGEDIPVINSTKISAKLSQFFGIGSQSKLPLRWPLEGQTSSVIASSYIGGISLERINSIVTNDSFGIYNSVPMLYFRVRSNHTESTLKSIEILNPGSVPFETATGGVKNVVKVSVYVDSNNDSKLSYDEDILVGELDCSKADASNQSDSAVISLISPEDGSDTGVSMSAYDESKSYPYNNEKDFFVVYTIGSSVDPGDAVAQLADIQASVNVTVGAQQVSSLVTLSGIDKTSPATPDPASSVSLTQSTVSIIDVEDIAPDTVFQGQEKAPVLKVTLIQNGDVDRLNIFIKNAGGSFRKDGSGVEKVWVYRDSDFNSVFSENDEFVSATSNFLSDSTIGNYAIIENVNFESTQETFFILYDLGQFSDVANPDGSVPASIQSELFGISGKTISGGSIGVLGELPLPTIPASVSLMTPPIHFTSLTASDAEPSSTASFNISITLENTSEDTLSIKSVAPKIYMSDISGSDISYEFTTDANDAFPISIEGSSEKTVTFELKHSEKRTKGIGIIDAVASYTVNGASLRLTRHKNSLTSFTSAVPSPLTFQMSGSTLAHSWQYPNFVEAVKFRRNSEETHFPKFGSLSTGDKLVIYFQSNGDVIDSSTLRVHRNDTLLTRDDSFASGRLVLSASSSDTKFSYDDLSGRLIIHSVGDTSGTITIDVSDSIGSLETIVISYDINTKVVLSQAMFYPNPFTFGSEDLILGYFTTQPCTVDMYLYNYNGKEILRDSHYTSNIGYDQFTIFSSTPELTPGVYLCKLVGTDDNGNISSTVAKLSVF